MKRKYDHYSPVGENILKKLRSFDVRKSGRIIEDTLSDIQANVFRLKSAIQQYSHPITNQALEKIVTHNTKKNQKKIIKIRQGIETQKGQKEALKTKLEAILLTPVMKPKQHALKNIVKKVLASDRFMTNVHQMILELDQDLNRLEFKKNELDQAPLANTGSEKMNLKIYFWQIGKEKIEEEQARKILQDTIIIINNDLEEKIESLYQELIILSLQIKIMDRLIRLSELPVVACNYSLRIHKGLIEKIFNINLNSTEMLLKKTSTDEEWYESLRKDRTSLKLSFTEHSQKSAITTPRLGTEEKTLNQMTLDAHDSTLQLLINWDSENEAAMEPLGEIDSDYQSDDGYFGFVFK